ncbi:hypothetical protein ASE31_20785 [Acidovorax sp. Root217]|nr:hypothetical protein ASE31_20785 [Acidovorax sp. Root217]
MVSTAGVTRLAGGDAAGNAGAAVPPGAHLVFIDSQVQDASSIAQSLPAGTQVVMLDASQDGLAQMAAYVAGRQGFESISLFSHGGPGAVQAGSAWLTSATVSAHADDLRVIGQALTEQGDLLFYGCKVGAGSEGQALLDSIAAITAADVAASGDNTGAAALGGNWNLERSTGAIEAAGLPDAAALAGFSTLLAAPTYETFDGVVLDDGQQTTVPQGQSFQVNGWTLSILGRDGNNDAQGLMAVTNQSSTTTLADNNNDKAMVFSGPYDNTFGNAAAVLKSTTGEEFSLQSITVENFASSGTDYSLVGYRNGVQVAGAKIDFQVASPLSGGSVVSVTGRPWTALDEIRIVRTNGQTDISIAVDDIAVSMAGPINAAPVIGNINGDAVTFTEKGSPVLLDAGSDAVVTDTDNANFDGGKLSFSIVTNNVWAQDTLAIVNQGTGAGQIGVSGNTVLYGGVAIGTFSGGSLNSPLEISLNSNATAQATQALVRSVEYNNTDANDPLTYLRTVQVTLHDGVDATSAGANIALQVQAVNDAPTLTGSALSPTYTENGSGVALFNVSALSAVESGQRFKSLVLTVNQVSDGASEVLRIDGTNVALTHANTLSTATNGMQVSVSVSGGVATVTLTKGSPYVNASALQTLLNGITYRNGSEHPTAGTRVVTLHQVQDDGGTANAGADTTLVSLASTVTVAAVNDAPIVTTSGGSAAFAAGDNTASTPVAIDSGLTLSDVDHTTLATATVKVAGNFSAGQDVLAFVNGNAGLFGNITGTYNAGTGVLELASAGATATLAQWQSALRGVTYTNTAVTPGTAARTISFEANDGVTPSALATRTVTVTAVDQTPVLSTSAGTTAYTEGQSGVVIDGGLAVSDLDNATLAAATVRITNNHHAAEDRLQFVNSNAATFGNIAASYDSATGTLTLASGGAIATLAQWQAALRAVTYSNTSADPLQDVRTISFVVNDGSKASAAGARLVSVAPVAPEPPEPPASNLVDGVPVTSAPGDGGSVVITIPVVPSSRPDSVATPNPALADIPLVKGPDGHPIVQVGVPVGVGLQAEGLPIAVTGTAALAELGLRIERLAAGNTELTNNGQVFYASMDPSEPLTVQTIKVTTGAGFDPKVPLVISGSTLAADGKQAVILDARALPAGSLVQVDNIDFIAVVGAVRVVGGQGQNVASGDGSSQWIVLGADDDVLHGGGGDDVVGSQGGNDRLYGDAGNDVIVGGKGDDHLEGGTGNDVLIGGPSDAGTWQFALAGDGRLHVGYVASQALLSELPQASLSVNLQGAAVIDPRLALLGHDYGKLETTSLLFKALTGQLPTLEAMNALTGTAWSRSDLLQGAWNWFEGTLPANASTADKAQALITQTLGGPQATAQNLKIAVDFLGQGGTWAQALDFLVHLPQVMASITTQTASGAQLSLVQNAVLSEAGWSAESGNDTLIAGTGNDVLIGGGGSDMLDGGEGTDMAVFIGTLQQYRFTLQTNATGQQEVLVRDTASGDVDTLRSIELLQIGGQAYRTPVAPPGATEYPMEGHLDAVGAAEIALVGLPAF